MSRGLQPLPSPGVGVFPDFIASHAVTLIMKGNYMGNSYNITTTDGEPVFRIESETLTLSNRKKVIDARSGRHLCSIRLSKLAMGWKYYAEAPEGGGPHLLDLHSHFSLGGSRNEVKFANAAENGRPTQMDFKDLDYGKEGTVRIGDVPVAVVERKLFKLRTEYHFHITAGLDMFLIVALVVALDDKKTTKAAIDAAGGGA